MAEFLAATDDLKKGSSAQVGITIGTFAKEQDAYLDAFFIMDALRIRFFSKRILDKRFKLIDEATWETPSNQPTPFFIVYGSLTYQTHLPQDTNLISFL